MKSLPVLGVLLISGLSLASCASNPVAPSELGEGMDGEEGADATVMGRDIVWYVRCKKEHNGVFGWRSEATRSRLTAVQWCNEHNNQWGHNAQVRQ